MFDNYILANLLLLLHTPLFVLLWEASIPIYLPCRASGGIVDRLHFFLTNEDGDPIDLLGDRYSAVVVVNDSQ